MYLLDIATQSLWCYGCTIFLWRCVYLYDAMCVVLYCYSYVQLLRCSMLCAYVLHYVFMPLCCVCALVYTLLLLSSKLYKTHIVNYLIIISIEYILFFNICLILTVYLAIGQSSSRESSWCTPLYIKICDTQYLELVLYIVCIAALTTIACILIYLFTYTSIYLFIYLCLYVIAYHYMCYLLVFLCLSISRSPCSFMQLSSYLLVIATQPTY